MTAFITVIIALALTELTECVAVLIWENDNKTLKSVLLCNLITNPAANLIMLGIGHLTDSLVVYFSILGSLELLTIYIEGIILSKMTDHGTKKSFKISLVLNLVSFLFGLSLMFL